MAGSEPEGERDAGEGAAEEEEEEISSPRPPIDPSERRKKAPLLFLTVLIIATAGLVYELIAGTLASYVLGDSVFQFSTIIGVYLSAMGLGAYLSGFLEKRLAQRFVEVELAAALVGGASAPFLFVTFAYGRAFRLILYGTVILIGALVGLELPLLMRILKRELDFRELVAKVLTFDYLGALVGSILFAVVLMPTLGLVRSSLLFGMLNAVVGLMSTWILSEVIYRSIRTRLRVAALVVLAGLGVAFVFAPRITHFAEVEMYSEPVVLARQTRYQRIVMTRSRRRFALFLNGNLQFSSDDEHRYHEALVHPAFAVAPEARRVLVLGGGDGLAAREILRHPGVEEVTLIELDPEMTDLARRNPLLSALNHRSFSDPRVHLVHEDAMVWLDRREADAPPYDVLIIDFPDPNNFSLGKLYTRRFYRLTRRVMGPESAMVVQSTSPFYARQSFWCIVRTIESAGLYARPYHAFVPSFGEWGYVLARPRPFDPPRRAPRVAGLRFLNDRTLRTLFAFPEDMSPIPAEVNVLNTQLLVQYYQREWSQMMN